MTVIFKILIPTKFFTFSNYWYSFSFKKTIVTQYRLCFFMFLLTFVESVLIPWSKDLCFQNFKFSAINFSLPFNAIISHQKIQTTADLTKSYFHFITSTGISVWRYTAKKDLLGCLITVLLSIARSIVLILMLILCI